ncbi:MAG: tRNA (guanosine(37)-N1)-methyltransferase TrmD [Candidatus Marinimicrobia bacterium]|nr:tRNA (guanosine(37)-N1)-methyltransferase TrmD [Candidatus Neomarinimicrobiota bacterium]
MIFHIFSIFPESFESYFNSSILSRAQENNLIKINIHNIRDFTEDKHSKTDDSPYGGGPGMVMKIEPIVKSLEFVFGKKRQKPLAILTSASGEFFNQDIAKTYSKKHKEIALICGHYEGVDERLKKVLSDLGYEVDELSIGSYVLTGGELPAMVIVDSISRYLPGVLGKEESLEDNRGFYPSFTRPDVFEYKGKKYEVPEVLVSGDHKKIEDWRKKNSKK